MLNRYAVLFVAGAAIFALDASVASLSKTRTSAFDEAHSNHERSAWRSRHARVDTVTVYKTDTLRLQGRVDTVTVTRTETITRVDTVLPDSRSSPADRRILHWARRRIVDARRELQ